MNTERFEAFSAAYRVGLLKAVVDKPEAYALNPGQSPADYASKTADRMLVCVKDTNIRNVNISGAGMRNACKALGIKQTYKASADYLAG